MSSRLLGGRYRLVERLGRGGTATVWRGRDVHLDRAVAVKVLHRTDPAQREALRRLQREARTVAQLDHPNIVGVYDFGLDRDTAYLVMALVQGQNLAELLAAEGPLPVDRAVRIASEVCGALEAAHRAGVVHRDIKPGNIIIGRDGVVKVCDFGIARLAVRPGADSPEDGNTIDGTCEFMAPEQVTGGTVSARSDLYGLGCVLYTMLTGRPPFVADDPLAVLDRHVNETPRPLRSWRIDLPPELDRLVGELLAKESVDRPTNATVVRDRLARLATAPPAGTETDPMEADPMEADRAGLAQGGLAQEGPGGAGLGGAGPTVHLPTAGLAGVATAPSATDTGGRHRRPSSLPEWWGLVCGQWRARASGRSRGRAGGRSWVAAVSSVAAIVVVLVTVGVVVASLDSNQPARTQDREESPRPSAAEPATPEADASSAVPGPTATAGPSRTPASIAPPAKPPVSFAAAIQQQVRNGQLDPRAGQELLQRLDKITRRPPAGRNDKAAQGLAQVGRRLDELRRDGQLTDTGFDALIVFTGAA